MVELGAEELDWLAQSPALNLKESLGVKTLRQALLSNITIRPQHAPLMNCSEMSYTHS